MIFNGHNRRLCEIEGAVSVSATTNRTEASVSCAAEILRNFFKSRQSATGKIRTDKTRPFSEGFQAARSSSLNVTLRETQMQSLTPQRALNDGGLAATCDLSSTPVQPTSHL